MSMMIGGNSPSLKISTSTPKGGGNQAKYWEEETVVAEVTKDSFAKYIISNCKKSGKRYINVREWYHTSNNPTWLPAKAGCAIPINGAVALNVIAAMAKTLGLEVVVYDGTNKP